MTMLKGALYVDRVPPTGSFTSPAAGNVNGTVTLTVTAADNDKVATVQFKVDGVNVGSPISNPGPYTTTHDSHLITVGAHTYSALITDRLGNQTTINRAVTCNNGIASGVMQFDEWEGSDGDGGYAGGRTVGPDFDHRWSYDYIWSAYGGKYGRALPSNPDSTHYQMKVQAGVSSTGRLEGNTIHLAMNIDGIGEFDTWANGSGFTPNQFGPIVNVNGGETVEMAKWETISGMNTSFTQGVGVYYSFAVKGGYLS
jgi:hypothetical protein